MERIRELEERDRKEIVECLISVKLSMFGYLTLMEARIASEMDLFQK